MSPQEKRIKSLEANPGAEPGELEAMRRQLTTPGKRKSMETKRDQESFLAATGMSSGKAIEQLDRQRIAEDAQMQEEIAAKLAGAEETQRAQKRAELAALLAAEEERKVARKDDTVRSLQSVSAAYGEKLAAEEDAKKDYEAFGSMLADMDISDADREIIVDVMSEGEDLEEWLKTEEGRALMARYEPDQDAQE